MCFKSQSEKGEVCKNQAIVDRYTSLYFRYLCKTEGYNGIKRGVICMFYDRGDDVEDIINR